MRTIKRNVVELGPLDEVTITVDPDLITIKETKHDDGNLTKGKLIKLLEEFPDDAEIVVTIPLVKGGELTYYLQSAVGTGWKVSGIAEVSVGIFATG